MCSTVSPCSPLTGKNWCLRQIETQTNPGRQTSLSRTGSKSPEFVHAQKGDVKRLFPGLLVLLALAFVSTPLKARELVRHDLRVVLYPEESRLAVRDTINLPENFPGPVRFLLHGGLKPSSPAPNVHVLRETEKPGTVPIESFRVTLPSGQRNFDLEYSGKIYHPLEPYGREYARGFRQTPGVISGEGVYLTGSSFWYPVFDDVLVNFTLQVKGPSGWDAVSQGERTLHSREGDSTRVRWESPEPQEEIFLVAAEFIEYREHTGRVETMVFLRNPDADLAKRYLDATVRYVPMYEELIGPYPYKKFALIENFWETGFGMPSFTLLGPKVIRFPFIIHSSYPHEILHNWWGNGVFPELERGNWAEGLTAYLSDHLIKEQVGKGAAYRQTTLQKYADYVLGGRDFPLVQFWSRHSSSSEAVGYGKSLMFFHMLRMHMADKLFVEGLRNFYRRNKFRFASFDDIRDGFEEVSPIDLEDEFDQWVTRTGAPEIRVREVNAGVEGDGYILTAHLEQVQPGGAYLLRIPVAITMEGHDRAYQTVVVMGEKRLELRVRVPARPLRLDIDPEFDIFRRLDREEIPPALTQAFGAKEMTILLPSAAPSVLVQTYRELSESLSASGPDDVEVKFDNELERLPSDRTVIVLGWENLFHKEVAAALSKYDVAINETVVRIGGSEIQRENRSVVLTTRLPENKDLSLTWIATDLPAALAGLGRKIPHYHKYSYLAFEGAEPANVSKGRWPVLDSPMTVFLSFEGGPSRKIEMGKLARRQPLAVLPALFSKNRMMETVRFLASDSLEGRGFGTEELDEAADYIARKFAEAGLKPGGDRRQSYFETWEDRGGHPERKVMMRNVIGLIPGTNPDREGESVVVGAHYDHLGLGWPDVREGNRGKIHHGADDNASGVAVLIELARVLGESLKPDRTVVFAAFAGEEAERKGSKYYVSSQKHYTPGRCIGMVNLDTVGRLEARKLLILGTGSAREWVHIFRGAGYVTGMDVEVVPEELGSGDQKSFHEAGVPAVQLFSGPHLDYHRPTDTADKIDQEGLVKVAYVAREVVQYLAGREEPMTATLKAAREVPREHKGERKVSLGTIPDFAFRGEGYRLSGVVPGSPADLSGLREGDVIVKIGSHSIHDLGDLSQILKSLNPGDVISITYHRGGKELTAEAELRVK
ncbi:MAG: M20/M25/M40 family metallo-hydrolase [Proteobacteria bacterium]|nr:M20/M25/M40 family metallo-hydrolase [Pseudomonadota bacterium]